MLLNAEGKPLFSTGSPDYTEIERQHNYAQFRKMYRCKKWNELYPDYEGRIFGNAEFKRRFNLIINFPGLISRACGDLLFGEPVRLKADKNNDYLQKIKMDSLLDSQFFTSEVANSYRGDAVFALTVVKDVAKIKTIPAYNYYILPNKIDCTIADAEYVAYQSTDNDGSPIVCIVEYTDGRIEHMVFEAKKSEVTEDGIKKGWRIGRRLSYASVYGEDAVGEVVEFDPALGRMIQHIPNFHDDEQYYGFSDYYDLTSIFNAINNRISNIDAYLDTHSKPKLIGTDELLDVEGNFDFQADFLSPPSESAKEIRYLTWDGKIQNGLDQLKYLESKMFQISEMSQAIFGIDLISSVDSSMAMRQFFTRTKAKINRKKMLYDERLKRFLVSVMRFCAEKKLPEAGECDSVDIMWQDGIPQDYTENVNTESQRVGAGLSSVKSAMKRIDLFSDEETEIEIQQIMKERELGILPEVSKDVASNGGGVNNSPDIENIQDSQKMNIAPKRARLLTKG